MNVVHIAGHVGRDPETRMTPGGQKVTSFTMATNYRKQGKDETQWWRITVWGERFDRMMPHIKKGSALMVVGDLSVSEYVDKNGEKKLGLEVNADKLSFSPFGRGQQELQQQQGQKQQQEDGFSVGEGAPAYSGSTSNDDDIPF